MTIGARPAHLADWRGPRSRAEIVERAESWLRPSVPYSATRFHQNEHGIYRTDGPGYASMAWGLPGVPPDLRGGLDAAELVDISVPIGRGTLLAGDLVLCDAGTRVLLFHEWAAGGRTRFWAFEQAPGTGTAHRVVELDRFAARRYPGLTAPGR